MESRGGFVSRKTAKGNQDHNRVKEIALSNSASTAASMEWRSELMEKQNAIHAYEINYCNTRGVKRDREEYMDLTRKAHLKRLLPLYVYKETITSPPQKWIQHYQHLLHLAIRSFHRLHRHHLHYQKC